MKNDIMTFLTIWLLVCANLIGLIMISPEGEVLASAKTIIVDDNGTPGIDCNYTKIQWAIDNASIGDTVFVKNGTYYENVVVNKSISLVGEDIDTTIIDGEGSGDVVRITADWVNIAGFSVTNGEYGIYLYSSNNNVTNNNITMNKNRGLYIYYSSNNNISNNNISNNHIGMSLVSAPDNTIIENQISGNSDGLLPYLSNNASIINNNISMNDNYGLGISSSNNNTLIDNQLWDNGHINLIVTGNQKEHFNHTIPTSNIINGKSLYYYFDLHDTILEGLDTTHLTIAWSDNVTLRKSDIYGGDFVYLPYTNNSTVIQANTYENYFGMYLHQSLNNNFSSVNVSSNRDIGVLISYSKNNKFSNNNISNNGDWSDHGFFITDSSYNNITDNEISNNIGYGISLQSSSDNTIYNNSILSNSDGIRLVTSSSNNNISDNTISGILYGIRILLSSNNNFIRNNSLIDNWWGIHITDSSGNMIYHNNIIDNIDQAYDNSNDNFWNDSYPSGGNYWSNFDESSEGAYDNFKGVNQDLGGNDGIVDNGTIAGGGKNPYIIDSDSQDNYPLMGPYIPKTFENYTILKQGWNLISLPLIQENQTLTKVLEMIDGYYDTVEWYNITDKTDPWKINNTNKPFGNDLFELNETMGFWIHITQPRDTIFLYNGTQPTVNQTITLHPGWNLVGYPSLTSYDRTTGLNNLIFDTHIDSIWTYNATIPKFKELGESDYFEIGRGYWIHAKTECVWEVPL